MKNFYSQYNQDEFIYNVFFKKVKTGFFLDIGAHDGVTFSNSCFFERSENWNGICVEPLPNVFEKLKVNRNCILENVCINDINGPVTFTRVTGGGEMLSGITHQYDQKHVARIDKEIAQIGGKKEEITVVGATIQSLITEHTVKQIDFCSIDTEGNELPILTSFPFDIIKPKVFLIENNYGDNQIADILKAAGYHFVYRTGDDIYKLGPVSSIEKFRMLLLKVKKKLQRVISK